MNLRSSFVLSIALLIAGSLVWQPRAAAEDTTQNLRASAMSAASHGQHRKAIAALERLRAAAPQDVEILVELASSYRIVRQSGRSAHYARAALALQPENSRALLTLGRIELANDNLALARSYLQRAINSDPQNAAAFLDLGQALTREGDAEAADIAFAAYAALTDAP